MLDVNPAGDHRLVIDIPSTLAAIDHAVIRVGPASSLPALHEDGQAVERVKPGRFHG